MAPLPLVPLMQGSSKSAVQTLAAPDCGETAAIACSEVAVYFCSFWDKADRTQYQEARIQNDLS